MSQYLNLFKGARDPWIRDLGSMQRTLDSLFEGMSGHGARAGVENSFNPDWEVRETKTHFLVSVDLPGVSKDEIKVELYDGRLTITGERKREKEADSTNQARYLVEKSYGAFSRSLQFPEPVDSEKVEAFHENGVLKITVAKTGAGRARQISIK